MRLIHKKSSWATQCLVCHQPIQEGAVMWYRPGDKATKLRGFVSHKRCWRPSDGRTKELHKSESAPWYYDDMSEGEGLDLYQFAANKHVHWLEFIVSQYRAGFREQEAALFSFQE